MFNYKIFIPCAGTGSRLKDLTKNKNKALIEVGGKPAISLIIEKFDSEIPIVIGLGYQKETLKKYLIENHQNRKFEFVNIEPFDGPQSGLGLTMLKCESKLQCPFIFIPNDCIVDEDVPLPTFNWMGYEILEDKEQYRCIEIGNNGYVIDLLEKKEKKNNMEAYIGLSGIYDYELFWQEMKNGNSNEVISQGESYGLRKMLLKTKIKAIKFTWSDTGNLNALEKTKAKYKTL